MHTRIYIVSWFVALCAKPVPNSDWSSVSLNSCLNFAAATEVAGGRSFNTEVGFGTQIFQTQSIFSDPSVWQRILIVTKNAKLFLVARHPLASITNHPQLLKSQAINSQICTLLKHLIHNTTLVVEDVKFIPVNIFPARMWISGTFIQILNLPCGPHLYFKMLMLLNFTTEKICVCVCFFSKLIRNKKKFLLAEK